MRQIHVLAFCYHCIMSMKIGLSAHNPADTKKKNGDLIRTGLLGLFVLQQIASSLS